MVARVDCMDTKMTMVDLLTTILSIKEIWGGHDLVAAITINLNCNLAPPPRIASSNGGKSRDKLLEFWLQYIFLLSK
ncbi:hypothetical protein LguiA_026810 [Lonicera macranthoides]